MTRLALFLLVLLPPPHDHGDRPPPKCTCSGQVACWVGEPRTLDDITSCVYPPIPSQQECPALRTELRSSCSAKERAKHPGPVAVTCAVDLICSGAS